MFYLTTHSIHFIYGYTASDIWLRTILIVRKENVYMDTRVFVYDCIVVVGTKPTLCVCTDHISHHMQYSLLKSS